MKQDIRDLFKENTLPKKKLPDLHREEFLEKLQKTGVENPTKKRFYTKLKVAVSIAAVIALIIMFQKENRTSANPMHDVVVTPVDTNLINPKRVAEIDNGEDLVLEKKPLEKNIKPRRKQVSKPSETKIALNKKEKKQEEEAVIKPMINAPELVSINKTLAHNSETLNIDTLKTPANTSSRIKVNSKALLYSVTHTKNETLAYYKENNLIRASILKDIEYELNKSSLAINAEELLSEIESGLNKKSFKDKLLATIKSRIKELSNTIVTN